MRWQVSLNLQTTNDSPLSPLTQQRCPGNDAGPFSSQILGRRVVRIDPEATRSLYTAETPAAQLNKGRPLRALIVAYTCAAPRSFRTLELIEDYLPIFGLAMEA